MYTSFYKLQLKPFALNPDPRFLWLGEGHQEALSTLRYGALENKGFLMLTGDAGTGKTIIVNELTRSFDENTIWATISDHSLGRLEFYNTIASGFKLERQFSSKVQFLIQFSHFLHQSDDEGKRVVLIVDDCHKLSQDMLEELRLLSNIEKSDAKLINIFFVGQSSFSEMLVQPKNRAVRQRLNLKAELKALSEDETAEYVRHRLQVAGSIAPIFTREALEKIYQYSGGIPRKINILGENALNVGAAQGAAEVDAKIVEMCVVRLNRPEGVMEGEAGSADETDGPGSVAIPIVGDSRPPVFGYNLENEKRHGWLKYGAVALVVAMVGGFLSVKYRQDDSAVPLAPPVLTKEQPPEQKNVAQEQLPEQKVPMTVAEATVSENTNVVTTKGMTPQEIKAAIIEHAYATADKSSEPQETGRLGEVAAESETLERPVVTAPANDGVPRPVPAEIAAVAEEIEREIQQREEKQVVAAQNPAGVVVAAVEEEESQPQQQLDVVATETDTAEQRADETATVPDLVEVVPALPPFEPRKYVLPLQANSTKMTQDGYRVFNDFVKKLKDYPRATMMVKGFVSAKTNSPENIKLSQERARGVYELLLSQGIDEERVELKGMGNQEPVASNDTSEGRRKNRRVEIVIVDDGASR